MPTAWAIARGGEGGGACPRAADEQLVGGGEGFCVLPSRKEGVRGIMRGDAPGASRGCMGRDRGASSACRSVGVTAVWGAGGAASRHRQSIKCEPLRPQDRCGASQLTPARPLLWLGSDLAEICPVVWMATVGVWEGEVEEER